MLNSHGPNTVRGPQPAAASNHAGPRALLDAVLFYLLLATFGLLSLLWSLPAGVLALILPRRIGRPLGQKAISLGFRWYIAALRGAGLLECDLSPLAPLRQESGLVIAANHPSLLDAVLLLSCLPRGVCIAKASNWRNPLLGGGIRLAGYVRNDAPLQMIRHAAAAVRDGRQLLIFPEGTRTRRGIALGPLSRSFAMMAQQAGAPVQTVLIECDTDYLRKGVSLFRVPSLPLRYRVHLGERFDTPRNTHSFSQDVEACLRAALPRPDPMQPDRT